MLIIATLALAAVVAKLHISLIDLPNVDRQVELHNQIVSHQAPAPYQFRVLQPVLVEGVLRVTGLGHSRHGFIVAYALIRMACVLGMMLFFFRFLRRYFTQVASLLGVAIVVALIPFTYRYYYYQPSSIAELALFAAALYYIAARKPVQTILIVLVGTLNRETMVFVPFLWFLWWMPKLGRGDFAIVIACVSVWAGIFVGLRHFWPAKSNLLDVMTCIDLNLHNLQGALDVALMTVPWAAWIFFSRKRVPGPLVRIAALSLVWLPLHFATALWWEVRFYLSSLLTLVPGLLATLLPDDMEDSAKRVC